MATEKWFGLDSGTPLSLKNRLLADLVQKLASMSFLQDKKDEELYEFLSSDGKKHIFVRIALRSGHEDNYYLVEILDPEKEVLISETIYWAGLPSTLGYHPFCELIELIEGRGSKELAKIQRINHLLATL